MWATYQSYWTGPAGYGVTGASTEEEYTYTHWASCCASPRALVRFIRVHCGCKRRPIALLASPRLSPSDRLIILWQWWLSFLPSINTRIAECGLGWDRSALAVPLSYAHAEPHSPSHPYQRSTTHTLSHLLRLLSMHMHKTQTCS
jgi:hypothetical protein